MFYNIRGNNVNITITLKTFLHLCGFGVNYSNPKCINAFVDKQLFCKLFLLTFNFQKSKLQLLGMINCQLWGKRDENFDLSTDI